VSNNTGPVGIGIANIQSQQAYLNQIQQAYQQAQNTPYPSFSQLAAQRQNMAHAVTTNVYAQTTYPAGNQQYAFGWYNPTSTISISIDDHSPAPLLEPVAVRVSEDPGDPKSYYRVPLYVEGDRYHLFVGHRTIRHFDKALLPDFLKAKLSLIESHPKAQEVTVKDGSSIQEMELFMNNFPPEFDDVGWRASKHYYIMIMTGEELDSLKLST
jgi:hypothetical protein